MNLPLESEEIETIEAKIAAIESMSDAELKLIITNHSWLGIKGKARKLFNRHVKGKAGEQYTILILIDIKNRELLLHGSEDINNKVHDGFWQEVTELMLEKLKENDLGQALGLGLHVLGDYLIPLLPSHDGSSNDLNNQIIFDL
jgi:uncharacterized membrane protein